MSTERQKQASRANGRKSHGATTPERKLASSRNAITHGMLSTTIVLKGESRDRFLWLLDALLEEFQPQTPFEQSLIENMAVARWRQMRIWGLEKVSMEDEMQKQSGLFNASEDPATRMARAFRTLSDDSRSLELINRYEARYDRQYLRAHRRFLELRDRRLQDSAKRTQEVPENKVGQTPRSASRSPDRLPPPPSQNLPAEPPFSPSSAPHPKALNSA